MQKKFLALIQECHEALHKLFDYIPESVQAKEFGSFLTILSVTGEINRGWNCSYRENKKLQAHIVTSATNLLEEDLAVIAVFSACVHISKGISSESITSLQKGLAKLQFAQNELCGQKTSLSGAA